VQLEGAAEHHRRQDLALHLLHDDDGEQHEARGDGPSVTSATSTATAPVSVAPMSGMKPPRKTRAASGTARGTPSSSSTTPRATASKAPSTAVPRR
jgi:hypothetical protein